MQHSAANQVIRQVIVVADRVPAGDDSEAVVCRLRSDDLDAIAVAERGLNSLRHVALRMPTMTCAKRMLSLKSMK
jgi:hypothetical protein